jgi:predicted permease
MTMTAISAQTSPFERHDGVDRLMRYVDEHFFDVVGIAPELGTFLAEDFIWRERAAGRAPVELYWPVIISHTMWLQDFGGDPSIVGRRVTRSERSDGRFGHVVRGVLPVDFVFPLDFGTRQADVLAPEGLSPARRQADLNRRYYVLGRIDNTLSGRAVEERLREFTRRQSPSRPSSGGSLHAPVFLPPFDSVDLISIVEHLGASARPGLRLIAGGAVLLMLIICLNVVALASARGVGCASEFATRRALGASSWRVARLVGAEVAVLIVAGATLGLWLAAPLLRVTLQLLPDSLVLLKAPAIDLRVVSATAFAAAFCGGLIAVLPAIRASRLDGPTAGLSRTRRGNRAMRKGSGILIGAQAALGFMLVTAGALTMTSLAMTWSRDSGYAADRTVLLEAYISNYTSSQDSVDKLTVGRHKLSQVPGVIGLAASNISMFKGMFPPVWAPVGSPAVDGTTDHQVEQTFFEVMGIGIVEGRLPGKTEWSPMDPFAVVSETAARLFWPGESALGRQIRSTRQPDAPSRTVIGVVRDARYEALDRDPLGSVYLPIDFDSRYGGFFVARTEDDPAKVIPGMLAAAGETGLRVERAVPLDDALFVASVHRALPAWLFGSLGLVGLMVLGIGTFGLLAMAAAQRTRELVIRVALGASSASVVRLLVRDQLTAVALGLSVGAAVAYWTAALLEAQLYRVSPFSPAVWLTSAGVLLAVATLATVIPSIRQTCIDPAQALRAE